MFIICYHIIKRQFTKIVTRRTSIDFNAPFCNINFVCCTLYGFCERNNRTHLYMSK